MRDLAAQDLLSRGHSPQTAAAVLMRAEALRFETAGRALLKDVTLDLRAGRHSVIMGPNGAGKSLLLRVLHGLARPTGGAVLWEARPLDAAARAQQAMVFQRPVLLRRSVAANLRFALAARGVPRRYRAEGVAAGLVRARLEPLANSPARRLSGGEQQRLALAMALAANPRLLFLDEPTASLDPASTQLVETMLGEARSAGVTLVTVTHDAGQARRIGDDLVFLQDGMVAETGPLTERLAAPRSAPLRAWMEGRLYIPETR
ncbi:ATP-binding cassette domain-containing protein [Cognatishimia sp. F0-27]|uniref:ABC transporter ATP-binding protein n=1 Tax=Cognatishimia sp. F0-27 TaxID=2816855 RepID=UPI001D0C8707|nr:ATP-binding cassette domain-containing protein [Cognatishimia sp. F0-27]MCC1492219.1 ATP-binding cassette domain-containing protein [Cognatishimia sp. F0-27]